MNAFCSLQINTGGNWRRPKGNLELSQDSGASRWAHLDQQHRHLAPGPEEDPEPAASSKQSQFLKNCSLIKCVWLRKNISPHTHPYFCKDVFVCSHKFFLKVFSKAKPWFFKSHGLGLTNIMGSYTCTHNLTSLHKCVICNITIAHLVISPNRETQREPLKMKSNQAGRFHRCPLLLITLKLRMLISHRSRNVKYLKGEEKRHWKPDCFCCL